MWSAADGVAIAWAVSEHLIQLGVATLFATHFAQLAELGALYPNTRLWHFEAKTGSGGGASGARERLMFTHRLLPGTQAGCQHELIMHHPFSGV